MTTLAFKMKLGNRVLNLGDYYDDGSFVKRVKASKHMFHQGNAFGIAVNALNKLTELGCKKVILYEMEREEKWEVDFQVFVAKSWFHKFKGYEEQKFLAKKWWDITSKAGLPMQVGQKIEPKKAVSPQQTLF